jgi:hypothetical protein
MSEDHIGNGCSSFLLLVKLAHKAKTQHQQRRKKPTHNSLKISFVALKNFPGGQPIPFVFLTSFIPFPFGHLFMLNFALAEFLPMVKLNQSLEGLLLCKALFIGLRYLTE